MSLRILWRFAVIAVVALLAYWFATHTYWADQTVPSTPRGQAVRDPFYAAEHLARALGADASEQRVWSLPSSNAIVVTAFWDWSRSSTERAQLEHWVESGGRLVVDLGFADSNDAFYRWSGITRHYDTSKRNQITANPGGCRDEKEGGVSLWPASAAPRHYTLCGLYVYSFLASTRVPVWRITDAVGIQALRVKVGQGSISVVNGEPFTYFRFLQGTHASLFVAATQLHTGDQVYFLSDEDHASLLAVAWRFGAPVVVLLLGALALTLWRAAPRFGPALASPDGARRSLAEQIRGTGQFLLRAGDGQALHAATVRALFAAAPRRISAFANLSSDERLNRLARASGFPAAALASAVNYTGARRVNELRSAIALLEAARRQILRNSDGSTDGN